MVYGRFLFCLIDSTASADARWTAETKEYLRESRVGLTPPPPDGRAYLLIFGTRYTSAARPRGLFTASGETSRCRKTFLFCTENGRRPIIRLVFVLNQSRPPERVIIIIPIVVQTAVVSRRNEKFVFTVDPFRFLSSTPTPTPNFSFSIRTRSC